MAIMENKKQLFLIVFAIFAGIIATVLTSTYVTQKIQEQAVQLKDEYEAKQKETLSAMQQDSEQKMAALAQEINKVKAESAEAVKQQMAAMQATQSAQARVPNARQQKPSLALKTPEGKRAVTIMVNSLAAVGGLLNPGDFVDVIAQLSIPAGSSKLKVEEKNMVTAMIFQDLQILAVNTNLEQEGIYYDEQQNAQSIRVTVAVDPQEAGLLSFADKNGKLELALRSPQEREHQMVQTSTWKTLADYVLQNQGADIDLPASLKGTKDQGDDKPKVDKSDIQIFRGGKEL